MPPRSGEARGSFPRSSFVRSVFVTSWGKEAPVHPEHTRARKMDVDAHDFAHEDASADTEMGGTTARRRKPQPQQTKVRTRRRTSLFYQLSFVPEPPFRSRTRIYPCPAQPRRVATVQSERPRNVARRLVWRAPPDGAGVRPREPRQRSHLRAAAKLTFTPPPKWMQEMLTYLCDDIVLLQLSFIATVRPHAPIVYRPHHRQSTWPCKRVGGWRATGRVPPPVLPCAQTVSLQRPSDLAPGRPRPEPP